MSQSNRSGFETATSFCLRILLRSLNPTVVVLKQLLKREIECPMLCLNPTVVVLKPLLKSDYQKFLKRLNPTVVVLKH